ncbi:HET-domain-containing protein [Hyaloscypha bicolor E]|uniref:HET-domain-containing protein n=1 Tax=Hyaloscypha bicolor E TaxID=1095630 RepID=A0A2J6T6I4_9HELO|nr:HET-domain-containing protein [Hyaloscypha bicolor E]PMD58619.1 HET-domain-containing protein [Hyaloscypha bicolor E]
MATNPRKRKLSMVTNTSEDAIPGPSDETQLLHQSVASLFAAKDLFDPKCKWPDDFYDPSKRHHRAPLKFKYIDYFNLDSGILMYDSTAGSPLLDPQKHPEWIYPSQIRAWVAACDSRHGTHCQSSRRDQTLPSWLIDCEAACIVGATVEMPYVALSYVWGPTSSGVVLRENLLNFQNSGALMDNAISTTIRNVIAILPIIGERYLWVDRLCIIQDDDDNSKARNINSMASIYSNAHMTLVVAIGEDANHGLRGFHKITPPLERQSTSMSLTAHQLTRVPILTRTKWYSRGWTLQEIVFSRRTLFLTSDGAFWECHCRTWSEDSTPDEVNGWASKCSREKADIFRDSYMQPLSWPNLHMYLQLVAAYNNRDLTFDYDILPAFAGITTTLSPSFPGGFLFGMPELFFDVALLWRPLGPSRRRRSTAPGEQNPTSKLHSVAFPSWSWVGWQTEVDPLSWKCGYDYIKNTRIKRSGEVPNGWSRYSLPFEGPGEVDYVHSSHVGTRFRFPIPLASGTAPVLSTSEDYGHLLICKTKRAYFRMAELQHGRIVTSVLDEDSKWVGVVRLHVEKKQLEPLGSQDKLVELPKQIPGEETWHIREFIEISEGTASNSAYEAGFLEEWKFKERPRDSEFYEFVNVLCISRHEGICYREGLGRVLKSAWCRQDPESIEVILG